MSNQHTTPWGHYVGMSVDERKLADERKRDAELDERLLLAEYRREQADWQVQS